MIKDRVYWEAWEAQGPLAAPPDFERNLRLVEDMHSYVRSLGVLSPTAPLDGLDAKLRMAKVLNVSAADGKNCPGA